MGVKEIMNADESGQELIRFAEAKASDLVRKLKRTQIRNIFTEARQIEALWEKGNSNELALRRLSMLKPKLAYQAKRHQPVEELKKVLDEAIDEIFKAEGDEQRYQKFKRFMELFEAILAFHRAKGGE